MINVFIVLLLYLNVFIVFYFALFFLIECILFCIVFVNWMYCCILFSIGFVNWMYIIVYYFVLFFLIKCICCILFSIGFIRVGSESGPEVLIYSLFDFINLLVDMPKFHGIIKENLKQLIYYITLYMQMSTDQVSASIPSSVVPRWVHVYSCECICTHLSAFVLMGVPVYRVQYIFLWMSRANTGIRSALLRRAG